MEENVLSVDEPAPALDPEIDGDAVLDISDQIFHRKIFLKNYLSIAFGRMSGTKRRLRKHILGAMTTITII